MVNLDEWSSRTGYKRSDLSDAYLDYFDAVSFLEKALGEPWPYGHMKTLYLQPKQNSVHEPFGPLTWWGIEWWRLAYKEVPRQHKAAALCLSEMQKLMRGQ